MKAIEKKQSWDYYLIASCYHEAAHAVIATLNYLKVSNISMMTSRDGAGYTFYDVFHEDKLEYNDKELYNILLHSELQVLYAGLIAEKIYYKDICGSSKFPMHLRIGSNGDNLSVSAIIRKNLIASPGKETVKLKQKIKKELERLLYDNWDAVKIVAHSLYKKRRLSFDDLQFILTKRTWHKDFWKDRFKKINFIYNRHIPEEQLVKELITK